jgi:hypothetical protein
VFLDAVPDGRPECHADHRHGCHPFRSRHREVLGHGVRLRFVEKCVDILGHPVEASQLRRQIGDALLGSVEFGRDPGAFATNFLD